MSAVMDNLINLFIFRDGTDLVNKQAQEYLFVAFNVYNDEDGCKKKFSDHQQVLFLLQESNMDIFYHAIKIGDTVYDNNVDTGLIEGVDKELATFNTLDTDIHLKTNRYGSTSSNINYCFGSYLYRMNEISN